MKKVMFLSAALVAAAFASCSQDETIDVNNGQGISFRAFTESSTRATEVTTQNLSSFHVYAFQGTDATGSSIWNDTFNRGTGNNFTSTATHYWPTDGSTLHFYAYNCLGSPFYTPAIDGTNKKLTNVQPVADASRQQDLVIAYAADSNTDGSSQAKAAQINFKHALTQVIVKALNSNEDLQVKVRGVRLNGLNHQADFTFPTTETDTNPDETLSLADCWASNSNTSSKQGDYKVTYSNELTLSTDTVTIMDAQSATTNRAFMILPQTLTAWNPDGAELTEDGQPNGAYISVLCQISIKNGESGWTQYFPSTVGEGNESNEGKYAWTAVPISTELQPGKRYTFRLDFKTGAGTTDPEQPEEEEEPDVVPVDPNEPVLGGTLSFDVTVSGWQDMDAVDVEM